MRTLDLQRIRKDFNVTQKALADMLNINQSFLSNIENGFRIVVRKQLAALNKKCGYNRAAELIKELTGENKLTEVNLADLPKVMDHAKEETNAD